MEAALPEWIWELVKTGGPAAMAALCLFLYLRESSKRDDAQAKYEALLKETSAEDKELTKQVVEALNNAEHAISVVTSTTNSVKDQLAAVISFIHSWMPNRGRRQ